MKTYATRRGIAQHHSITSSTVARSASWRDFFELSKLPQIDRHLLGAPWGTVLPNSGAAGEEEFGQANLDTDVLPEPAGRLEIVKHVAGYSKILSEQDLKLEMAPQEVVTLG